MASAASQMLLRLNVAREVDLAAGPPTEGGGVGTTSAPPSASYSGQAGLRRLLAGVVARGAPLAVCVSVPLVVINHSQLPVSVGVLALALNNQVREKGREGCSCMFCSLLITGHEWPFS